MEYTYAILFVTISIHYKIVGSSPILLIQCEQEKCSKPGEIYLICGPKSEPTCFVGDDDGVCSNSNEPSSADQSSCTGECNAGCFCRQGSIRHPNGSCGLSGDCPICDWDTQVYTTCGTACPTTCVNFNDTQRPPCPEICVPRCVCKDGLVEDDVGNCIRPERCPTLCRREHEIYDWCGTACPKTCGNLRIMQQRCLEICVQGCFCRPEYVRSASGECVLPYNCPLKEVCTAPNENYTKCGSQVEQTCDNFWTYTPDSGCKEVCQCDKGYVRNHDGNCVNPKECPDICPNPGEEYYSFGLVVEMTCDNNNNTINSSEIPGCYCKNGLVRHQNGECVNRTDCPVCDWDTQIYDICGSSCPDNCYNYLEKSRMCNANCVAGCFCKDGLVLDDEGNCIPPKKCRDTLYKKFRNFLLQLWRVRLVEYFYSH